MWYNAGRNREESAQNRLRIAGAQRLRNEQAAVKTVPANVGERTAGPGDAPATGTD